MQTFKLDQQRFKELRKNIIIRLLSFSAMVVAVFFCIFYFSPYDKAPHWESLQLFIPLMLVTWSFGIYRGVKKQKELFNSYVLTISNNMVMRERLETPTISVYFNDINEIIKHKNGSITIKGKDKSDVIAIPVQAENFAVIESLLQSAKPIITETQVPLMQKYSSLGGVITGILMICVYTVNNKIIVGITGTLLIVFMLWSFAKLRTSKNVDENTKKSMNWIWIVIISVIGIMFYKLTGHA
jgi:hypothetical protein